MDSLMPGIDVRLSVSSIALQSSSDIRTAEPLLPTTCMEVCDSLTSSTKLYSRFLASDAYGLLVTMLSSSDFYSFGVSLVI